MGEAAMQCQWDSAVQGWMGWVGRRSGWAATLPFTGPVHQGALNKGVEGVHGGGDRGRGLGALRTLALDGVPADALAAILADKGSVLVELPVAAALAVVN